jgi:hypothetical protein
MRASGALITQVSAGLVLERYTPGPALHNVVEQV